MPTASTATRLREPYADSVWRRRWPPAGSPRSVSNWRASTPHLVISSRPNTVDPGGRAAWYKLSPEPDEASEACLRGRRWRRPNPPLEALLSFIDEVEALVGSGRELEGC